MAILYILKFTNTHFAGGSVGKVNMLLEVFFAGFEILSDIPD